MRNRHLIDSQEKDELPTKMNYQSSENNELWARKAQDDTYEEL